jgi:hypothetical protein
MRSEEHDQKPDERRIQRLSKLLDDAERLKRLDPMLYDQVRKLAERDCRPAQNS